MFAPDERLRRAYRAGLASLQASRFTDTLDQLAAAEGRPRRRPGPTPSRPPSAPPSARPTPPPSSPAGAVARPAADELEDQIETRLDAALIEAAVPRPARRQAGRRDPHRAGRHRRPPGRGAPGGRGRRSPQRSPHAGRRWRRAAAAAVSGSPVGNISVTTVGGITVASHIAGQISALLQDAAAAGIILGGGGYRSSDAQIAVRRSNCGPSQYDIWQKPSSPVPPAGGAAGPVHARAGRGHRLHLQRRAHHARAATPATGGWRPTPGATASVGNSREAWHWSTNGR